MGRRLPQPLIPLASALITGGTRGIGLAIAERFAKDGLDVGLIYASDDAAAERAASKIREQTSVKVAVAKADVADAEACKRAVKELEEALGGRVEVLVNNAGLVKDALFLFSDPAASAELMQVHLFGAMHMVRATLKGMIAKRSGCIINVISPSAFRGRPGQTAYAAAKGALLAFTTTLAQEVGAAGVRVNALLPGVIDTDMVRALPEAVQTELRARIAMERFGKPEEVSAAAALLLRARYMHAAVLSVDGGLM